MIRFAAIVVTYFPDGPSVRHLHQLSKLCPRLFILDNTPPTVEIQFPRSSNVKVCSFTTNVGLASALNAGIQLAGQENYENIFLLDQDSRLPHDFFRKMLLFKAQLQATSNDWVLFVPNFYDRNSHTYAKFPVLKPLTFKHATCCNLKSTSPYSVTLTITSGTLITYTAYQEIGPLRDDYFIDFVDNEYCLRANKLGYKIALNCNVTIDHAIGNRCTKRFLGITIKPNFHPPLRRYYIARNGIRTAIDYARPYPSYFLLIIARIVHEFLAILFFEERKHKKLGALFHGIYDGLLGRMGKVEDMSH